MLTKAQLDHLCGIETICQDCIRAGKYFDAVSGSRTNMWAFTRNCYGSICIIYWCQVFGSNKEPAHYSKLFAQGTITTMTEDTVAERLRTCVSMTKRQYNSFHKGVTYARNKFFAHYQYRIKDIPEFPDIDLLISTSLEMRSIVRDIAYNETAFDQKNLKDFVAAVSYHTNARYLSEVESGVESLRHSAFPKKR